MDTSHAHSPQNSPSDTASYSSRRRIAKDRRDSFTFDGIKMELDVSAVGYDKYDKHPKLSPVGGTVSAIGHRRPPTPLQIPHFQRLQPGSLVCSPHLDECDLTPSDAGGVTLSDAKANGNDFSNSTRGQQFGSPNLRQVERRLSSGAFRPRNVLKHMKNFVMCFKTTQSKQSNVVQIGMRRNIES